MLEQRPASGLWGGLWSFPQFDDDAALDDWLAIHAPDAQREPAWPTLSHTFSHFRLHIVPQLVRLARDSAAVTEPGRLWYNPREPASIGLAAPVKTLLETLAHSTTQAEERSR